jgi:hypothetical protein
MTEKKIAERFEEWFRSRAEGCMTEEEIIEKLEPNFQEAVDAGDWFFVDPTTQHDWEVWQAAWSSCQEEVSGVDLSEDTKQKMGKEFFDFLNSPYRGEWNQLMKVQMRAGEVGQLLERKNVLSGQMIVPKDWRYNPASD